MHEKKQNLALCEGICVESSDDSCSDSPFVREFQLVLFGSLCCDSRMTCTVKKVGKWITALHNRHIWYHSQIITTDCSCHFPSCRDVFGAVKQRNVLQGRNVRAVYDRVQSGTNSPCYHDAVVLAIQSNLNVTKPIKFIAYFVTLKITVNMKC